MRKFWLLIGALAVLALFACEACAAAPTPILLLPTSTSAPTSSPVAAAPAQAPLPTSEPATCTMFSHKPTPGPTEVSLFPGVSQADWKQGPDDAKVVFIEYGDFQ